MAEKDYIYIQGAKVYKEDDMNDTQELVILHGIEGFSRLSGKDQHGCCWIQFEVDWGTVECTCDAMCDDSDTECQCGWEECGICGDMIESGWLCLDGGEEVCDSHVIVPEEMEV